MGAWNEEPAGSDEAQVVVVNSIEQPIMVTIMTTLDQFLQDPADDVKKAQSQMAVALLLDLTSTFGRFKYIQFSPSYIASRKGFGTRPQKRFKRLLSQDKWLAQWTSPKKKVIVLNRLLAELEIAKKRAESG